MLASQLPPASRVACKLHPGADWTVDTHLLHSIEYSLRVLVWSKTKDAEKGRNKPKPIPLPGQAKTVEQVDRNEERVRARLKMD